MVDTQKESVIENRYSLHEVASRILLDSTFRTSSEKLQIDQEIYPRVTKCHKVPLMKGNKTSHVEGVVIRKHVEHGSVSFGGLMACGSVWSCPICSAKISEWRCAEIARAFEIWRDMDSKGNHTQIMVTFTIPHYANQSISDLREIFMKARRLMKQQKVLKRKVKRKGFDPEYITVYSDIAKIYGIKGSISGIEVTYGYHGWHPHSHDIFFVNRDLSDSELKQLKIDLTNAWIYACDRAKLSIKNYKDMLKISVDVRRAKTAAEYIAKFGQDTFEKYQDILNPSWGASQEITKSHIKTGYGRKGFTPWDFLRIIKANPDDRAIYLRFGKKFSDYVREFHGKRQLFWSKGFKKFLDIEDMSDQEIAQDENQDSKIDNVGVIPAPLWRDIVKYKLRGWVLNKARGTNFSTERDFQGFLGKIRERIKKHESKGQTKET